MANNIQTPVFALFCVMVWVYCVQSPLFPLKGNLDTTPYNDNSLLKVLSQFVVEELDWPPLRPSTPLGWTDRLFYRPTSAPDLTNELVAGIGASPRRQVPKSCGKPRGGRNASRLMPKLFKNQESYMRLMLGCPHILAVLYITWNTGKNLLQNV